MRYVTATPAVLKKITGLGTCAPDTLAAEVALPPPADLLGMPAGQLRRVLVLDGIQVGGYGRGRTMMWGPGACLPWLRRACRAARGRQPAPRRPAPPAPQDPGNLGTLCRTALALGWQAAVLLPGCCDPFNDKAIRASRGAVFKLPVAHMSLEQWQQLVQAHGLVALAAEPDRSGSTSSSSGRGKASQQQQGAAGQQGGDLAELPVALCLGAEGQGVSAQLWAQCRAVTIPQAGGGALMESLNVAAAGSILMFALSRGAGPLLAELGAL